MPKPAVFVRLLIACTIFLGAFTPKSMTLAKDVEQQQENADCSNLDIVFIVDQSWSMSAPGTQEAADPLNQRKFAVDAMIDLLVGLALDQCPGTHHRIGVISYGTSARVDLSLYDINPITAEQANVLRDENGIKKQIVADNLGGNNPEAAFVQAQKMWHYEPTVDDVGGKRKKVVIFFTNGISNIQEDYAKGAETLKNRVNTLFPYDAGLLKLEACLSGFRKQSEDGFVNLDDANECMTANPVREDAYENSTYIWTVFLKPPGYQQYGTSYSSMINHYAEMSQAHGGDVVELKPNARKDVPSTFRHIVSFLAGVRPVLLNCGEFAVNPYLREFRITVYKIDPKIKITLAYVDQSGNRYSLVDGQASSPDAFSIKDYYSFGANEAYILSYPYAGIWQLTADNCQGIDTYNELPNVDVSRELYIPDLIPQYEVAPFYDPEHPQPLVYEMHDKETGTLIPQASHPRFVVDTTATVTSPAGDKKEYILKWDAVSQSFISTEPLQVAKTGVYDVHMTGTTYVHEGAASPLETVNPELVFDKPFTLFDINAQFEVAPVTPFTIDVVYPPPGETIKNVHDLTFDKWPPLDIAPLPIRVRLLDRDGNMIAKPEDFLASIQGVFTAHVESEGQISEPIILQPDPNNPGYFTGEIPNFEVVGGEQNITVVMDESAMLKDRRPYNRGVESDFTRKDDLFHMPVFWQFLLLFFLLSIMISLVFLTYSPIRKQSQKEPLLLVNMISGYSTMGDLVLFPLQLPWSPDELNRKRKDIKLIVEGLLPISDIAKEILEESNPFIQRMHLLDAKNFSGSLRQAILGTLDRRKRNLWLPVVSQWENIFEREWQILEKKIAGGLIENPYEVGNPLRVERKDLFRGRTELRDAIIAALRDKSHFTMILSGQRRMGKTSLLLQLPALLPPETIPVFIDLQKPANTASDGAFLYAIAQAIHQSLKSKQIEVISLSRSALFQSTFELFDNWLDEVVLSAIGNSIILLAFDEFEKVGQALSIGRLSDRSLDELRHTIQHRQQIAVLFAGVQTLDELGPKWSSYFLNVRSFSIGYLSHDEAESLIRNPDPQSKFPLVYTENAVRHIIEITHCHPFLVQLVCSCVVERVNAKQPLQFNIDLEIVREAENLALERGEPYFRNVWDEMAASDAQPLLKKIALADFLSYENLDHSLSKEMDRLLRYHVVTKQKQGYIVEAPLVKRWVVERSPVE